MSDWTEHEKTVSDMGAKRAAAYIRMLEEELEELRKSKDRTTSLVVIEILEHCGMDGEEARMAFWNALSCQKIVLDEKRRVYAALTKEQVRREYS
jgi:hypothetical protein